ncbi:MAG TPA: alpha-L-rhamnosidase N-terminal domain-containing protein [Terracidiphilus sp.]|nr:alpha-L-rhamnosidase N-terminal domain-containing protein [Terracidiphilus sp.]
MLIKPYLHSGENVIGVSVLYYGQGDGTWVMGKPGLLFQLNLEWSGNRSEQVVSDQHWHAHLAQSWAPGRNRRWYLRAFQEQFDARLYPFGWDKHGFKPECARRTAAIYSTGGDKPSVCGTNADMM